MALETFDEVAHALVLGRPHPDFDDEAEIPRVASDLL